MFKYVDHEAIGLYKTEPFEECFKNNSSLKRQGKTINTPFWSKNYI